MNDWTCDLCGAYILSGFEAQHEWWHREVRPGQRVTFSPAPTPLPQPQSSTGKVTTNPAAFVYNPPSQPVFDAGTLTREKFRELFGIDPQAPEFKTVQDIEDYLNER